MQRALNGMFPEELKESLQAMGEAPYRAKQLFHFFHVERGTDLLQATALPKALRDRLAERASLCVPRIVKTFASKDGTQKHLVALSDGVVIETVFMPYSDRNTLCVSTQVGCRQGCAFCASTKARFVRNLRAEEMLAQVDVAEKAAEARVDNLVLMGIGEPLDNYEEVLRFLRLLTHPEGRHLSARAITLSTCGLVPQILRLAEEGLMIQLAISLHSTSDAQRQRTMPIAKRYSIDELLAACRVFFEKTGRRISFEYVLIRGENDREEDVQWLGEHLADPRFHLNLIPLNAIREYRAEAAAQRELRSFARKLEARGVRVSIRQKRGADIEGACGQLRIDYQEEQETL